MGANKGRDSGAMARLLLCLAALVAPAMGSGPLGISTLFCGVITVPFFCTQRTKPTPETTGCDGLGCCMGSSCKTLPMMGCRMARGETDCVGGGVFSRGMCRCDDGACGSGGMCASSGLGAAHGPYAQLFEETAAVPPEDFTAATALLGFIAFGTLAGAVVVARRLRRYNTEAALLLEGVDEPLADCEQVVE